MLRKRHVSTIVLYTSTPANLEPDFCDMQRQVIYRSLCEALNQLNIPEIYNVVKDCEVKGITRCEIFYCIDEPTNY